jgi:hypothetical protein
LKEAEWETGGELSSCELLCARVGAADVHEATHHTTAPHSIAQHHTT